MVALSDGSVALQAKDGNVVKRLQIHGWDNNVSYFRSDDGGMTWPEGVALLKASDLAVKAIGATTAPPSYPFRCQIRSFGRMGVCSYYGRWTSSAGDPVILHMDCVLDTKVDFSAAGSDGKAYPGYAYENGDVHLFANTSGSDINVFFSFTFIIA